MLCLASASQSSLLEELPRYRLGRISMGNSCVTCVCVSSHSEDEPDDRASSQPEPEMRRDLEKRNGKLLNQNHFILYYCLNRCTSDFYSLGYLFSAKELNFPSK